MARERDRLDRWRKYDFYEVLGVSPSATTAEIKKGFKRVALTCHPDKVPEEERENATRRFQLIAEAYEVLANESTRRQYDLSRPLPRTPINRYDRPPEPPKPRGQTSGASQPSSAPKPQAQAQRPSQQPPPGPKFGFNAAGLGPRCEGCDRRCPVVDVRNCPECESVGELSPICPACKICAKCAPEDEYGDGKKQQKREVLRPQQQRSDGWRFKPQQGAGQVPEPKQAPPFPATRWPNKPSTGYPRTGHKPPQDEGPPTPPRERPRASAADATSQPNTPAKQPGATASQKATSPPKATPPPKATASPSPHGNSPQAVPGIPRVFTPAQDSNGAAGSNGSKANPPQAPTHANEDLLEFHRMKVRIADLVSNLIAMGYSEDAAQAASMRCSSIEAAVDYLNASGGRAIAEPKQDTGQKEPDDDDDSALDMIGILLAFGFRESDARAATERCSTVEAAVEYIMSLDGGGDGMRKTNMPPKSRRHPALESDARNSAPSVPVQQRPPPTDSIEEQWVRMPGGDRVDEPRVEALAKEKPYDFTTAAVSAGVRRRSELVEALVNLGFSEDQSMEASRRCSSLEAAVEWMLTQPVAAGPGRMAI